MNLREDLVRGIYAYGKSHLIEHRHCAPIGTHHTQI
jgi:hypothetical protein